MLKKLRIDTVRSLFTSAQAIWFIGNLCIIPFIVAVLGYAWVVPTFDYYDNSATNPLPLYIALAMSIGCSITTTQWLMLRHSLPSFSSWMRQGTMYSFIGLLCAFFLFGVSERLIDNDKVIGYVTVVFGFGGTLMIGQWKYIRSFVRLSWLWIASSLIGWSFWAFMFNWYSCSVNPYLC